MTLATSSPPSPGRAAKGTMAIGTGSRTPEVTSISSAACARAHGGSRHQRGDQEAREGTQGWHRHSHIMELISCN